MPDASVQWAAFRWYLVSDLSATVSARAFQLFCTWYYLKVTTDPGDLSGILILVWIASTAALPFAGGLAESVNKGKVLIFAATLIALASMVGVWSPLLSTQRSVLLGLMGSALLSSIAIGFLTPLATPLIPELLGEEQTSQKAFRLKSATYVLNMFLGPALGGIVIGLLGGQACLYFCMVSAVVSLTSSIIFHRRFRPPPLPSGRLSVGSLLRDICVGAKRVSMIPAERTVALFSMAANFVVLPFMFFLLPAKVLPFGYSMLQLASLEVAFGLGVLAASGVLLQFLEKVFNRYLIAVFSIFVMALCLFLCSRTDRFPALVVLVAAMGAGLTCFNVTVNAKRAFAIPFGSRSTMEAALQFACTAAAPLGFWVAKVYMATLGADSTISAAGILFLLAVSGLTVSKALRDMLDAPKGETPYYVLTNSRLFSEKVPR